MKLFSINEHAYELMKVMKYFSFMGDEDYLIVDWLNMAAGVSEVIIVTEKYDSSIYMCDRALQVEKEKSILWSEISKELISFNFIWGSVESLIKKVCPKSKVKQTITRARLFLRENYKFDIIPEYELILNQLLYLIKDDITDEVNKNIEGENFFSRGIYIASKVRNMFAHGSRRLPETEDYCGELTNDIEIIKLSSRVALFTMQMILLATYYDDHLYIEDPTLFDFLAEEELRLNRVLFNLHYKNYLSAIDSEQSSLTI